MTLRKACQCQPSTASGPRLVCRGRIHEGHPVLFTVFLFALAPWNRHPPSRQCSCSWSASWQGLREALAHQLHCRPEFCYWALWAAIIVALLALL